MTSKLKIGAVILAVSIACLVLLTPVPNTQATNIQEEEPVQYNANQPEYWTQQGYEVVGVTSCAGEIVSAVLWKPHDEEYKLSGVRIFIDYEDQEISACLGSSESCSYVPGSVNIAWNDLTYAYRDDLVWASHIEYDPVTGVFTYFYTEA